MSEKRNCKTPDYSVYDTMETRELEEILRQDAEISNRQKSDVEKILYISGVLANRETENNTGNNAKIAWESFEKDYLPIEEDIEVTSPTRVATHSRVRRLAAIAAVLVLLIGLSATVVKAFNWEEVWTTVAKWTKDTFSFVSRGDAEVTNSDESTQLPHSSFPDTLTTMGLGYVEVPTVVPDGYTLKEIIVDGTPVQQIYVAHYENNGKYYMVTVRTYLGSSPERIEISEDLIEIYKAADLEYYIFSNNQHLCAAWQKGSYEGLISGDLTLDEIKTMINSIEKG